VRVGSRDAKGSLDDGWRWRHAWVIRSAVRAVLIAAKQLALAKTRLAPAFPAAAERSALAEAMFRDVLAAALSARLPVMVAVVTSDAALIALARAGGAIVIDEEYPRGLNVAVGLGTEFLIGRGATTVCTLLSDIPLVTGEDIDASFAAIAPGGAGVTLVPSVDLTGTNMMTRMPPDVIQTRFGRLSLARHVDDCRAQGVPCEVVRMARPAIDLDVPRDLIEFARMPSMTHTFGKLSRLGVIHG
jgi:2-phospho-L-lactate guanylyltransferase